jgi:hypothetical protein
VGHRTGCHTSLPPPHKTYTSDMAGSGGSINDDLRHCGFIPDDDAEADGNDDGGPSM